MTKLGRTPLESLKKEGEKDLDAKHEGNACNGGVGLCVWTVHTVMLNMKVMLAMEGWGCVCGLYIQ